MLQRNSWYFSMFQKNNWYFSMLQKNNWHIGTCFREIIGTFLCFREIHNWYFLWVSSNWTTSCHNVIFIPLSWYFTSQASALSHLMRGNNVIQEQTDKAIPTPRMMQNSLSYHVESTLSLKCESTLWTQKYLCKSYFSTFPICPHGIKVGISVCQIIKQIWCTDCCTFETTFHLARYWPFHIFQMCVKSWLLRGIAFSFSTFPTNVPNIENSIPDCAFSFYMVL